MKKRQARELIKEFKLFFHCGAQLFFPERCAACDVTIDEMFKRNICEDCWQRIYDPKTEIWSTPKHFPSIAVSLGHYASPLGQLIKMSKFHAKPFPLPCFEELVKTQQAFFKAQKLDALCAVPGVRRRIQQRCFDLPVFLAQYISRRFDIPMKQAWLLRNISTQAQSGLKGTKRKQSFEGVFHATTHVKEKRILIIDDVMTTRSTLKAVARELHSKGARQVFTLCLARSNNEQ